MGEPLCYYVSWVTSALEQTFIRQCILLKTLDEKNALLNDFRVRESMTLSGNDISEEVRSL